jgi:hypothetical protein
MPKIKQFLSAPFKQSLLSPVEVPFAKNGSLDAAKSNEMARLPAIARRRRVLAIPASVSWVQRSGFSRSSSEDEIPLQCGLRLNPCFADNTLFLNEGFLVRKIEKVEG